MRQLWKENKSEIIMNSLVT